MSKTLSVTLRPKSFKDLYGQEMITSAIRAQVKSGRMPAVWMFCGESGSGKTTLALIIALSLQCTHAKFGSPCDACWKNRDSFSIREENAAQFNSAEAMRSLVEYSNIRPLPPSRRRVIILDEAQNVQRVTQNILLKPMEPREDDDNRTVWIICTTDPEKIQKAMKRRALVYYTQPLRGSNVAGFIKYAARKGSITKPTIDFVEAVRRHGLTSSGIILMAMERWASGIDPVNAVLGIDSSVNTYRVCENLLRNNWGPVRSELMNASPDGARAIRIGLLGWLCNRLLDPKAVINRVSVVKTIEDLTKINYVDDAAAKAAVTAVLYTAMKRKF